MTVAAAAFAPFAALVPTRRQPVAQRLPRSAVLRRNLAALVGDIAGFAVVALAGAASLTVALEGAGLIKLGQ